MSFPIKCNRLLIDCGVSNDPTAVNKIKGINNNGSHQVIRVKNGRVSPVKVKYKSQSDNGDVKFVENGNNIDEWDGKIELEPPYNSGDSEEINSAELTYNSSSSSDRIITDVEHKSENASTYIIDRDSIRIALD